MSNIQFAYKEWKWVPCITIISCLPKIPKAPKAVHFEKKRERGGQGSTTRDGISYGAEGYIYERQLTISFNLGGGGGEISGDVYVVRDKKAPLRYALKKVRYFNALSWEPISKAISQAKELTQVSHENVVALEVAETYTTTDSKKYCF